MRLNPGIVARAGKSGPVSGSDAPDSMVFGYRLGGVSAKDAAAVLTNAILLSNVPVGNFVFVAVASDNTATVDGGAAGKDDIVSVTDSVGNTYTYVLGWTNGNGAAKAGVSVSLWMTRATFAMTQSVTTITVTNATAGYARAWCAFHVYVAPGQTLAIAASGGKDADVGIASVSFAGLLNNSKQYLYIGVSGDENDTPIATAGLGTWTRSDEYGTTGGNAATNITCALFYYLGVATDKQFSPSNNAECATIHVAFKEVYI